MEHFTSEHIQNHLTRNSRIPMATAALFIIAQPKCSPTDELMKKMGHICSVDIRLTINKNKIWPC